MCRTLIDCAPFTSFLSSFPPFAFPPPLSPPFDFAMIFGFLAGVALVRRGEVE